MKFYILFNKLLFLQLILCIIEEKNMSFLLLRGEKYHCIQCEKVLTVEFQEEKEYQIGDQAVYEQTLLNKKGKWIFNKTSDMGNYYHKEAICDKCLSNINNTMIISEIGELDNLLEKYITHINSFNELKETYWNNAINEVNPRHINELIERILSSKHDNHETTQKLLQNRLKDLKERVLSGIYNGIEQNEAFRVWKTEMQTQIKKICNITHELLKRNLFIEIDTTSPRSLNPYIVFELTTIAYPVPQQDKTNFYLPYNEDLTETIANIQVDAEKAINHVQKDLSQIAKQQLKDFEGFLQVKGVDISLLIADRSK